MQHLTSENTNSKIIAFYELQQYFKHCSRLLKCVLFLYKKLVAQIIKVFCQLVDYHYHFRLSHLDMISWYRHLRVQHPVIDQKIFRKIIDWVWLTKHFDISTSTNVVAIPLLSEVIEFSLYQISIAVPSTRLVQTILKILLSFSCQWFKKIRMPVALKRRNWDHNASFF